MFLTDKKIEIYTPNSFLKNLHPRIKKNTGDYKKRPRENVVVSCLFVCLFLTVLGAFLFAVVDAFCAFVFSRFWGVFGAWRAVPGAGRPPELIKQKHLFKSDRFFSGVRLKQKA